MGEGNFIERLKRITPALHGIPRDEDLDTSERVYKNGNEREVRWRTVFRYGHELQVVEATLEQGAEFPIHVHERVCNCQPEFCTEILMVRGGMCRIEYYCEEYPERIDKSYIVRQNDVIVIPPGVPHKLTGLEYSSLFIAVYPVGKGL